MAPAAVTLVSNSPDFCNLTVSSPPPIDCDAKAKLKIKQTNKRNETQRCDALEEGSWGSRHFAVLVSLLAYSTTGHAFQQHRLGSVRVMLNNWKTGKLTRVTNIAPGLISMT